MPRWEQGTADRLRRAALELFVECGYDGTTVADIAARAGATERTFYRHFADKREVLFPDGTAFAAPFLAAVADAPATGTADPMALVATALEQGGAMFSLERREWSRARQRVIDAHPALRERELLKLSALATALTEALVARGVGAVGAALAAESGVAVFRTAFTAWIGSDEERGFGDVQREVLGELATVVAPDRASGT